MEAQTICACTCVNLAIFFIIFKSYLTNANSIPITMRNKMFIKIAQLFVEIIAIREICKMQFARCCVTSQWLLTHSTFSEYTILYPHADNASDFVTTNTL